MAVDQHAVKEQLRGFCQAIVQFIQAQAAAELLQAQAAAELLPQLSDVIAKCSSLRGLQMIVSDLVEWTQDIDGDQLVALDAHLESKGLPKLTAMRSAEYRRRLQVLARGRINTPDEARLLEAWLADMGGSGPSDGERARANRLLQEFRLRLGAPEQTD